MIKARPCPWCGSVRFAFRGYRKAQVVCDECGACGPTAKNDQWAVVLWNQLQVTLSGDKDE